MVSAQARLLPNSVHAKGKPHVRYRHLAELRAAMHEARELIDAANHHVAAGALYKALKEIRKLMKREEEFAAA
jgi:flagellar biosynthesis regulator FlbT